MAYEVAKAFDSAVRDFEDAKDKNGNHLSMTYLGISHEGRRFSKQFEADVAVDLRSVSKPVFSITLGSLIESGVVLRGAPLSLDTLVAPLLDRHFTSNSERMAWENVRVRHLLTNTAGHDEGLLFRKDLAGIADDDYVQYALGRPINHEPGSHFAYSNVGPFLLSVIIQDHLGKSFFDIAKERVLGPLGIESAWRNYGEYTAGCTGLSMRGADLLTFGEMILSRGNFHGTCVVDTDWISAASSVQVESPSMFDSARVFPKFGYGYSFWVCPDGSFYCDGTDGQYLIIVPQSSLVIVTTGSQADMKPITRCMLPILEAVGSR